jgi:uncharacterized protein YjeT (DUF2065 family)
MTVKNVIGIVGVSAVVIGWIIYYILQLGW